MLCRSVSFQRDSDVNASRPASKVQGLSVSDSCFYISPNLHALQRCRWVNEWMSLFSDTASHVYYSQMPSLARNAWLCRSQETMSHLFPALCPMCVFPRFSQSVHYLQKWHRPSYPFHHSWCHLVATHRFSVKFSCNLQCCLASPPGSTPPCSDPPSPPLLLLLSLGCDIGHIANCMHWPKIPLPILSHSPCFTATWGQQAPWSIMSSTVCISKQPTTPNPSTSNPKWADPPFSFFLLKDALTISSGT